MQMVTCGIQMLLHGVKVQKKLVPLQSEDSNRSAVIRTGPVAQLVRAPDS